MKKLITVLVLISINGIAMATDCMPVSKGICTIDQTPNFTSVELNGKLIKSFYGSDHETKARNAALKLEAGGVCVFIE